LADAGGVEEAHDAVGRLRALLEPGLHLVHVELETLLVVLRQQRIEVAEPLDEAAVARRARVGSDDVIDGPLLGAGAGHAKYDGHWWSFLLVSVVRLLSVLFKHVRREAPHFFFPKPGKFGGSPPGVGSLPGPRPGIPGIPGGSPGAPGRPGMPGDRPPGIFS